MVLFGIRVRERDRIYYLQLFFGTGESNSNGENRDKYPCEFSKLIEYWRQTWNQRTNGNTDIHFPFGFVQVNTNKPMIRVLVINLLHSYQHLRTIVQRLVDFHGFDGIKHLMLAMYQIMLFLKSSWLLL
jgi:hypothetical protein